MIIRKVKRMSLREINYNINTDGISPGVEQFAGTQGDHRVTRLNFVFSDKFHQEIDELGAEGDKVMYRFDVYDGEGGIWQSGPTELTGQDVAFTLEERHTRFGGKVAVYLVITALSDDNETEIELYSFPSVLRLKNRPEGVYQDGENYESVTGLAQKAQKSADYAANSSAEANDFANIAEEQAQKAEASASSAEAALTNIKTTVTTALDEAKSSGEFDGVGVESAKIIDDELVVTYTNGVVQNLGNVKGDTGAQGEKGDIGPAGKDAEVDQTYNGQSENAQSGKALDNIFAQFDSRIIEALNYGIAVDHKLEENYYTKTEVDNLDCVQCISTENGDLILSPPDYDVDVVGSRIKNVGEPTDDTDAATKGYVDGIVNDIETALDELHNYAQAIIGGAE